MTARAFQVVLDTFKVSLSASAQKHILLMMDNPPWHTSNTVLIPGGVEVIYQPSYSPQLQAAEHLWRLSDELVTNRCLDDLNDLEPRLFTQCEHLMQDPERIKAHTLFHWWSRLY